MWLSALTTVTCMARLCGRNRPRSDRRWKRETATAREAEVMDGKAIAGQVREENWDCRFFFLAKNRPKGSYEFFFDDLHWELKTIQFSP